MAAATTTLQGNLRSKTTSELREIGDKSLILSPILVFEHELNEFMIDMKVDDLIAMLEPYRGKEVYIKCAYHNLDIKEVKVERYSHAGDYTHKVYERVQIVPDSGDMFDIFYDD